MILEDSKDNDNELTIRSIDFDERIDYINKHFSDVKNPYFKNLNKYEKLAVIDDFSFNIDLIGEYNEENNTDRYHTNPLPLSYVKNILDRKSLNDEYSYFNLSREGQKKHYDEVIREYNREHLNDFLPSFHNDRQYSYYTVTSREIFDKVMQHIEKEKITPFIALPDYDQVLDNIKKAGQSDIYNDVSKEGYNYTKFYIVIDSERNRWERLPRQDLILLGDNAKNINDTLNLEIKCNASGLKSKSYYYSENTRELCHNIKELGNINSEKYNPWDYASSLNKIADYIHSQNIIDKDSVIVPAPQHTGKAEYTLDLAECLYNRSGCQIADVLKAEPHDMLYDQKKNGKETELKLYLDKENKFALRTIRDAQENGKKIYLLDNVISTGKTFNESAKLIPGIIPCSYSISDFARIGFDNGKYFVYNRLEGISMNNNLMAENMRLQGDNGRWAVVDWDKNKNMALLRRCNYFDSKTDNYVIASNYTLYGDSVNPMITWGHGSYMDNVSEEYAEGIFKCRKNGMEVALSVPDGWKMATGVTTTPNGFVAITNRASRWYDEEHRKTMFIWKENFDRDMKEKKLSEQKDFLENASKKFSSSVQNTREGKKAAVIDREELLNENLSENQKEKIVTGCELYAKNTNVYLKKDNIKTKGNKRS